MAGAYRRIKEVEKHGGFEVPAIGTYEKVQKQLAQGGIIQEMEQRSRQMKAFELATKTPPSTRLMPIARRSSIDDKVTEQLESASMVPQFSSK